ncbi:MAG TPA: phage Gp37/Gp68 family protein [Ignavibacteria bacterium]
MKHTKIEWTEVTWNPTTGCNKVSAGCKNCYAEIFAKRLQAMGNQKYRNGFELTIHPDVLDEPKRWKNSKIVFVNSMSDIFHERIPLNFLKKVFKVMNDTPRHIYQVLTKRSERLEEIANKFEWTENIWMGVSVEDDRVINRIANLKNTPAKIKFLSLEPLLSSLPNLNLKGIDWVIVGGESGTKSRPVQKEWIIDIKDQCEKANVEFFFKQWGGMNKKANGRELNGKVYNGMPKIQINQQYIFS